MKQGWLTLVTVASLYGTYRLYAAVLTPMTEPQVAVGQNVSTGQPPEIKPQSITGRIARSHLADYPWTFEAKGRWQRGEETFLFFNKQHSIGDDKENKMRVTPFALVWIDRRRTDAAAYTLVCSSAVIEFESKIQFGQSIGRIIGGQLEGEVRITGPDHLRIVGSDFVLSERDQRLYSNDPVQFAYGPEPDSFERVRGRGDGIDITLKDQADTLLGHDMPRIGGLRKVILWSDVTMQLVMEDRGQPVSVQVTSQGRFTYNVEDLVATFRESVLIEHPTHTAGQPVQFDRVSCDYLELIFEDDADQAARIAAEAASARGSAAPVTTTPARSSRERLEAINLDVAFRSLRARGDEVLLASEENDFTARMQELHYDAVTRTVEMRDNAQVVEAYHGQDELFCPFVRLTHDDDDKIVTADCEGKGQVLRRNAETDEIEVEANWTQSLRLAPDEESTWDVLTITGDGHVLQRAQQVGIMADTLTVWLDSQSTQATGGDLRAALASADDEDELPVKKVIASSNVAMVSPALHLETQHLEADFVKGNVVTADASAGESRPVAVSSESAAADKENTRQPISVSAESVVAQLIFDPANEKTDVKQLDATTNVSISRASPLTDGVGSDRTADPFSIESDELTLINRGGSHFLRLEGTPARIRHPEADIEGNILYLDRAANLAVVEGAGSLTALVDSDLEGRPLDDHEKHLIVRWEEEMRFDGQQAIFLKDVRTTLADSTMLSQKMTVVLNRRLSFTEDRPRTDGLEIERVHCQEGVEGEFKEWDGTAWVGIRQFRLDQIVMERGTGEFHAQGPGVIDDWSRGGRRRRVRIDSTASSNANQPLRNDEWPWDYTRVKFAGELSGNHRDRYVTLSERVEIMHGPVENARTMIDRDDEFAQATERAKKAIFIGSDKLQVSLVSGESGTEDTVRVIAWENAELEGLVFRGRAHSISYDESKEMFTLKGRGTEASLWHQDQPGDEPREVAAKTIQFVPSKRLVLDGTRLIQGGR